MSQCNGKPQYRIETWNPQKARKQLELNRDNRPLNENWVLQLAQTMEAGEFVLNGETIKISDDGTLKDGQHRLHAIVVSGQTVDMLTVRGLPSDCFDTIDQGKKRTVGDIFARHGEANAKLIAAAVSWVWRYENGAMTKTGNNARPRPAQSIDVLNRHPGIRDSASAGRECFKILAPSIGVAAHYLFARIDKQKADEFFSSLASGENLNKTRGVYQFRERMIANKASKTKLRSIDIFAILIKAWNFERSGSRVKNLRWSNGANEDFPTIQ